MFLSHSGIVQCNVPCGDGTQRRDIICVKKMGNDFTVVPSTECAHLEKPVAVQECQMGECQSSWFTTEWSAVSRDVTGIVWNLSPGVCLNSLFLLHLPLFPSSVHVLVGGACRWGRFDVLHQTKRTAKHAMPAANPNRNRPATQYPAAHKSQVGEPKAVHSCVF